MAFNNYYSDSSSEGEKKELAYDLRQVLAQHLGKIREAIIESRIVRDYPRWFFLLDNLYIEVSKKLNDDEMKEYESLFIKANKIIQGNPKGYEKGSQNGADVYSSLKRIDIWLNRKMEQNDMFGSKEMDEDGL